MNDQANSGVAVQDLPEYLRDYEALSEHFQSHLADLTTTEKGRRFAHFVQRLIPQTDVGSQFEMPRLSSTESHDDGVDMSSQGRTSQSILYVQAKLGIHRAETIDGILSKFLAHKHKQHSSGRLYLFEPDEQPTQYVVATLSPLARVLEKYVATRFATREFYDALHAERRLHFIDGHQILAILRGAYTKMHGIPTKLSLTLATPVISLGTVFFGIVSSPELQRMYRECGDALFFENVRDFLELGRQNEREGRTSVNAEIVKTIRTHPERLLERNNGIVFRADAVAIGETPQQLILSGGSIVNGCQTSMCLIENAESPCYVSVKIVQTEESWDIAKAANYQNPVDVIDLDLARHLRPQLAKRAAMRLGVRVDDKRRSATQIIDDIYDRRVTYEETRLLYIGLFSKTPNNVFATNYTELLQGAIARFAQQDPGGERIFELLFKLQTCSEEGLRRAEERFRGKEYARKFQRFYKDQRPSYRCFVAILALCGAVGTCISDRLKDEEAEYERMAQFFEASRNLLDGNRDRFLGFYRHAVKEWMREMIVSGADDREVQQEMATRSRRADFKKIYTDLMLEADDDDALRGIPQV